MTWLHRQAPDHASSGPRNSRPGGADGAPRIASLTGSCDRGAGVCILTREKKYSVINRDGVVAHKVDDVLAEQGGRCGHTSRSGHDSSRTGNGAVPADVALRPRPWVEFLSGAARANDWLPVRCFGEEVPGNPGKMGVSLRRGLWDTRR